jgi:UDP-glucose 4-epimerase
MSDDAWRAFKGARVLIAGGLGFIGSTLARRLAGLGAYVLAVDALLPGQGGNRCNLDRADGGIAVEIADLRQADAAKLVAGRDFLFNMAGQQSHLGSMEDPETDLALNCGVALRLLEACRKAAPGIAVVYTSTRQVYGRPLRLPVDETHPLAPVDVNGIHKLAAESYHALYRETYGLKSTVLRLTNVYGPRMRIKDANQTFLGLWLRAILEGRPFEVWEGAQLRDFTYVDDAVEALLLAAAMPSAAGGTFNLGGFQPVSLGLLAEMLVAANGGGNFAAKSFPPERKRIDIGDYHANDARFRSATGWQPRIALADGLKRALDYFRSRFANYV